MPAIEAIHSDQAPAAIGPYSQAIRHDKTLYLSGQLGLDPQSGQLVEGGFNAQAQCVLSNLQAVAKAAGSSLDHALKLTVYLTDLNDFSTLNSLMSELFNAPLPARAAIQVAALPRGACVEIDAIIALP